jgi:S-adenosylmethionine synthetase
MFEKVNPSHPDKVADRIAGALVDYAYSKKQNPIIAVEVLIGHGKCFVIIESDVYIKETKIQKIIKRIAGITRYESIIVKQDHLLNGNQKGKLRCGDNGIFKGTPISAEQKELTNIATKIYKEFPFDGKFILDGKKITVCQSNATEDRLKKYLNGYESKINPLGYWTGGLNVDSGATNRKLGSDMGDGITGGGINGKDLSKADVSVNIYCFIKAQELGRPYECSCSIGDEEVDGKPYEEIVKIAREYIKSLGGFEKFAEWGLVRKY